MKKIYAIRSRKYEIIKSKRYADKIVNEFINWNDLEFSKYTTEELVQLEDELQDLKRSLVENPIDAKISDAIVKISNNINKYIEKENG